MFKKILLLLVFAVLSSFLVTAAQVRFVAPTLVVSDVPFTVDVQMNSENIAVARIQFYITSRGNLVNFISSQRNNVWLQDSTINQNEAQDNSIKWKYNVGPKGALNEQTNEYKSVIQLRVKATVADSITLTTPITDSSTDNIIVAYPSGAGIAATITNLDINPQESDCSDGVVGYIDQNENGIKDGDDIEEACDSALTGGDGCSADCSYIKATHKIIGTRSLAEQHTCSFGSRTCSLELLGDKDKLLAKLSAIFDLPADVSATNPNCFPYADHPQTVSSFTGDRNGAFCIIREGPAAQFNFFLNALLDYYRVKGYIS